MRGVRDAGCARLTPAAGTNARRQAAVPRLPAGSHGRRGGAVLAVSTCPGEGTCVEEALHKRARWGVPQALLCESKAQITEPAVPRWGSPEGRNYVFPTNQPRTINTSRRIMNVHATSAHPLRRARPMAPTPSRERCAQSRAQAQGCSQVYRSCFKYSDGKLRMGPSESSCQSSRVPNVCGRASEIWS
jgi:hypothetical protein